VASGLDTFDTRDCTAGTNSTLGPDNTYTLNPLFSNRATFDSAQFILDEIKQFAFQNQTGTAGLPSPACTKQAAQPSLGQIAEMSDYTHVYANP
jgi:hypothetical protein